MKRGQPPTIRIGTDEYRVNDEAVAALVREPDLYQRGGALVHVVEATDVDQEPTLAIRRPVGSPVLRELPLTLLRERLARAARWVRIAAEGEERPAHPPGWSVAAVHARGQWPDVRCLEAIIPHPVIRADGSPILARGYDQATGLLVITPSYLCIRPQMRPTQQEASGAAAELLDLISDFPFESTAHRSAWLAGVLTPLCWFMFDGPAPLFLIDGNVRGVGKGLLADTIALLLTGRRFAVTGYTRDPAELAKKITTLAVESERLVLFDNLAGIFGCDVLDRALTADRWKDRILGSNRHYDGPLHICWYATGNNVQIQADTARRVCHIRMESAEERPEERAEFQHPDLRSYILTHRERLLAAAITLVRGWHIAGRPRHNLLPWGSFEGWSSVVREILVWAGLPDPGLTRTALAESADRDGLAMSALIGVLEQMDPGGRGLTAAELVERIKFPPSPSPDWLPDLRSAIEDLCGRVDSRALGNRLRHFQRRNFGGRMVVQRGQTRDKVTRWIVVRANAQRVETDPADPASILLSGAGSAGSAGSVPGPSEIESEPDLWPM